MIAFAGGYDDFQVFDLLLILKKLGVCVAILLLSFLEAQFKLADGLFILFNLIINKEYYDLSSENKWNMMFIFLKLWKVYIFFTNYF